jgi:hypothetical protein
LASIAKNHIYFSALLPLLHGFSHYFQLWTSVRRLLKASFVRCVSLRAICSRMSQGVPIKWKGPTQFHCYVLANSLF